MVDRFLRKPKNDREQKEQDAGVFVVYDDDFIPDAFKDKKRMR